MRQKIEIDYNKVYHSNTGDFRIIEEIEPKRYNKAVRRMVIVEFITTGYRKATQLASAIHGEVKDPYFPTVHGVACLGDIDKYKERHNKKIYDVWFHMIERCYNVNSKPYQFYGAEGVTVSNDWLVYENFLRDLPRIPGYFEYCRQPQKYVLDKDLKQSSIPKNMRVYSVETCMFIDRQANIFIRSADHKNDNQNNSNLYGVYLTPTNTYQCTINYKHTKIFIGSFSNEIAAANAYNYFYTICYKDSVMYGAPNNVPYMPPYEWIKYITTDRQRQRTFELMQQISTHTQDFYIDNKIYPSNPMQYMCKVVK